MKPATTREKLKVAARQQIALHGVDVGVRDIMKGAGARNASALSYHFGSKDGLIEELLRDIFAYAADRWERRLEALGGLEQATTRQIVEILVEEASWATASDTSPNVTRFLNNVMKIRSWRSEGIRTLLRESKYNALLRQIARNAVGTPPQVMHQRLIFFAWYLLATMSVLEGAQVALAEGEHTPMWKDHDARANLADTAVALLEAPVSPRKVPTEA